MRFIVGLLFVAMSAIAGTPSMAFDDHRPGHPVHHFPGERIACLQWFADHPDFQPYFKNLPPVCFWHYTGWQCEQPWTPAGWLRPGGYCDAVIAQKSIAPVGSGLGLPPPAEEPCEYPTYPVGLTAAPPPNDECDEGPY